MIYCKVCVTPNTLPNGRLNEHGVCTACEFAQQSHEANYASRFADLQRIVRERRRGERRSRWQCIVGVSGGKDSTRQALWVREKLGLNPLLVSVAYPPRQITQVGADNLSNLIKLGFDTVVLGPAPALSRKLVRTAFFKFCNWCKATEMALFAGVPQVALERGIKLILWGENGALQVGDLGSLGDSMWDADNLVNGNTLAGGDLSWFREVAGGDRTLSPYKFPAKDKLRRAGVHTIFLGPAWKDWAPEVNSTVAIAHGLRTRVNNDPLVSGDMFGTAMVDEDWTIVNMLLKFYKLGYSRATGHASQLIRRGVITREEGIAMAETYDAVCGDEYIASFCRYVEITEQEFWSVVKKFANPRLFDCSGLRPVKRFVVGQGLRLAA